MNNDPFDPVEEGDDFAFFYGLFWALKWTTISGAILAGVLSWVLP